MGRRIVSGDSPTKLQQLIIDFVYVYSEYHGFYPSVREVSEFTNINFSLVTLCLVYIRKKGYFAKVRGIAFTKEGYEQARDVSKMREMLHEYTRNNWDQLVSAAENISVSDR